MTKLKALDLCGADPKPMTCPEVNALKQLIRATVKGQPSGGADKMVVVNIGAGRGISTLAMLEECPKTTIYSVDIGECPTEQENIKKAGLNPKKVVRLLGKSQVIGKNWDEHVGGKIDFLFIDGDHSYSGVKADIVVWTPLLREGGILAFHDYIPDPIPQHVHGRVAYAVDEMITDKEYLELIWINRLRAYEKKRTKQ